MEPGVQDHRYILMQFNTRVDYMRACLEVQAHIHIHMHTYIPSVNQNISIEQSHIDFNIYI